MLALLKKLLKVKSMSECKIFAKGERLDFRPPIVEIIVTLPVIRGKK